MLAVEVGPGHVGHGGALAALLLSVSRVQGGSLSIIDAVLTSDNQSLLSYSFFYIFNLYQNGLVVQSLLREAVRARLVGSGGAHHADDQLHGGVIVRGVGDGAGLNHVTVTLIRSVLTLKLVTLLRA